MIRVARVFLVVILFLSFTVSVGCNDAYKADLSVAVSIEEAEAICRAIVEGGYSADIRIKSIVSANGVCFILYDVTGARPWEVVSRNKQLEEVGLPFRFE